MKTDCRRWCWITGREPNPPKTRYCTHGTQWRFTTTSSDGDHNMWEPVKHEWLTQLSKLVNWRRS